MSHAKPPLAGIPFEKKEDGTRVYDEQDLKDFFAKAREYKPSNNADIKRLKVGAIDVHKNVLVAAVCLTDPLTLKGTYYVLKTSTTNNDIIRLAQWFKSYGVEDIIMESTGKYWIPVFNNLEKQGLKPALTHPKYVKQPHGQKTDYRDAVHMANLFRQDLIVTSFIPPADIRDIRDLCRYWMKLTAIATGEKNRFQNTMTVSQIRLDSVLSDPFGKTATNIMNYLVNTPRDEVDEGVIIGMVNKHVKAKPEEILESIRGYEFIGSQQSKMQIINDHLECIQTAIEKINAALQYYKEKYAAQISLLKTVPGIRDQSAIYIIGEIGVDMSQWSTVDQMISWCGLCPAANESAGKKKSTRISKGGHYLKPLMVQCALAAIKNKESYYGIKYFHLRARRGHKKAIIAIARMMMTAIYNMLKDGTVFSPSDMKEVMDSSKKKVAEPSLESICSILEKHGCNEETLKTVRAQYAGSVDDKAENASSDKQESVPTMTSTESTEDNQTLSEATSEENVSSQSCAETQVVKKTRKKGVPRQKKSSNHKQTSSKKQQTPETEGGCSD